MRNIAGNRALAARYARALLEVTVAESDPRQVEADLSHFVALLGEHRQLGRVLTNPAVPVARKAAIVGEIAERVGYAAPVAKLLKLLAERDHLALARLLEENYRRRLLEHLGIVEADVTTATPLPATQATLLAQALAGATGRQVRMTAQVDPAVIGGVVAKVGSTVYDGSIATQLRRIKEKMTENA